jgi:hypothetical protein
MSDDPTDPHLANRKQTADARRSGRPILWPAMPPEEALEEWEALRAWVAQLLRRYSISLRLPTCWWRHNDFVEALSALRDFERAAFSPSAPATAAVEWQRALREIESVLEGWSKRLTCSVSDTDHDPHEQAPSAEPPGWRQFVQDDARRRLEAERHRSG